MKHTNGPDAILWLESDLNGFERGAIDKRCLFSAGRHSCWPLMWWKVSQSQSLKMFLRVLPHKSALCCWEDFFPLTLFRDVSAWKRLNTWLQKPAIIALNVIMTVLAQKQTNKKPLSPGFLSLGGQSWGVSSICIHRGIESLQGTHLYSQRCLSLYNPCKNNHMLHRVSPVKQSSLTSPHSNTHAHEFCRKNVFLHKNRRLTQPCRPGHLQTKCTHIHKFTQ